MPKISVIVPVYKVEPYLRRCVDSILNQTFSDLELILVDDGSPDGCPAICDEYAGKDSRVHVLHQKNGGLAAARNTGIAWAKANSDSRWLCFVDSDDWVHPSFLEYLWKAAQEYQAPVSCCKFQRIHDGELPALIGDYKATLRKTEDVYCSDRGIGVEAYSWRFLYEKRLFANVSFPAGKIYEDIFTTYKLIFQTQYVAEVNMGLYFYFYRDNSLSHSVWTPRQMDKLEAIEENLRYFERTHYEKTKKCLALGYLVALQDQHEMLKKNMRNSLEKKRYERILKRKMRMALRRYKRTAGITLKQDGYLYAVVYPRFMDMYWLLFGQLQKLKK